MLIINADDYGRSEQETDAALCCFQAGRVTSASAMVFMKDSGRAAELAKEHNLDIGLHLNFTQRYDGEIGDSRISKRQSRLVAFQTSTKYSVLVYHPGLRRVFQDVYQDQFDEFLRLYGRPPTHIDGHQHRHLCANMLFAPVIPSGQKVRRSFSFGPGEKSWIKRAYRRWIDGRLARRYLITDYLFNLAECMGPERFEKIVGLARESKVELETHPYKQIEKQFLMRDDFDQLLGGTRLGAYALL